MLALDPALATKRGKVAGAATPQAREQRIERPQPILFDRLAELSHMTTDSGEIDAIAQGMNAYT